MTTLEEAKYIELYKSGDQEARNALIERNLRLVVYMVNKYRTAKKDYEDMISVGTIGLIKAVNSYSFNNGTRLSTYAAKCIDNEIRMYLRSVARQKNEVSLNEPVLTESDGSEISLMDILQSNSRPIIEEVIVRIQSKNIYDKLKTALKEKERKVIVLRYGLYNREEKTQQEVADKLGISRSYVSRIEKKAIKKLAGELNA